MYLRLLTHDSCQVLVGLRPESMGCISTETIFSDVESRSNFVIVSFKYPLTDGDSNWL